MPCWAGWLANQEAWGPYTVSYVHASFTWMSWVLCCAGHACLAFCSYFPSDVRVLVGIRELAMDGLPVRSRVECMTDGYRRQITRLKRTKAAGRACEREPARWRGICLRFPRLLGCTRGRPAREEDLCPEEEGHVWWSESPMSLPWRIQIHDPRKNGPIPFAL